MLFEDFITSEKEKWGRRSTIHLFITYLLSTYYGLGTILGPGEMAVIKSDKTPAFKELIFWWEKTDNKHICNM